MITRFMPVMAICPCLIIALAIPAQDGVPSSDLDSVPRSLAWITCIGTGKPQRATGFVIERPGDGAPVIVTAGHVIRGGLVMSARFPGMDQGVLCDLIDVDDEMDIMAVAPRRPIRVKPLALSAADLPKDGAVWLFGCPGGLESSRQRGEIHARPMYARDLPEDWYEYVQPGRRTPRGNTVLIRHSAPSSPGVSGGPLVDRNGKVLGVQVGMMPDGPSESFAVSARHLEQLNLNALPDKEFKKARIAGNMALQPSLKPTSDAALPVRVHDETIDARCFYNGHVSKDANTVISTYLPEPEAFRKDFTVERLQQYLAKHSLGHITNPAFGFSLLVPEKYTLETVGIEDPSGIRVTLTSGDPAVAARYKQVTVMAFLTDGYYADNFVQWNRAAEELIAQKAPENGRNPFLKMVTHRNVVKGFTISKAFAHFERAVLGFQPRDGVTVSESGPSGRVFTKVTLNDMSSTRMDTRGVADGWVRVNYLDEKNGDGHAVHCGGWENVAVIVHYQFRAEDRENYSAGKPVANYFEPSGFLMGTCLTRHSGSRWRF